RALASRQTRTRTRTRTRTSTRTSTSAGSFHQLLVVLLHLILVLRGGLALHRVEQILAELLRRLVLLGAGDLHRLLVHAAARGLLLGPPLLLHLLLHLGQLLQRLRLLARGVPRVALLQLVAGPLHVLPGVLQPLGHLRRQLHGLAVGARLGRKLAL